MCWPGPLPNFIVYFISFFVTRNSSCRTQLKQFPAQYDLMHAIWRAVAVAAMGLLHGGNTGHVLAFNTQTIPMRVVPCGRLACLRLRGGCDEVLCASNCASCASFAQMMT